MRKLHWLLLVIGVMTISLLFSSPALVEEQEQPKPLLDHFKVYKVINKDLEETVWLTAGFDTDEQKAVLDALTHFANPVSKNDEGIVHPKGHLTWYRLNQDETEQQRTVKFKNQFGIQQWVLGQPKFLLVPAGKNDEGFPRKLDHYKAYEVLDVIGDRPEPSVSLVDQWYQQTSNLGEAKFYCFPVTKRTEENEAKPLSVPRRQLAVYKIDRMNLDQGKKFVAKDQFGKHDLKVKDSFWLCVPSKRAPVDPDEVE